jgi:Dual specificity phosphatase, catalytic domain
MNGIDTGLYSKILDGLYMGGTADEDIICYPKSLGQIGEKSEFDSVATLYASAHPFSWGVSERRFGFPDSALDAKNLPEIHAISEWVHSEWKQGKRVLARCQAGWNRSGIILALVLMLDGYKAEDAIALIRARRSPNALCNKDFVAYLNSLCAKNRDKSNS